MPRRSGLRPGLQVVTRAGGTSLYLRGTVAGRRIFESTGTDDPKLAEERRAAREAQLHREAFHGPAPVPVEQVRFAQAALSYLEDEPRSAATEIAVAKLVRAIGPDMAADDVDQAVLDQAAKLILRPGSKPATRLRQVITPARAVLRFAALRGWCGTRRFARTKKGGTRTDWLTPAEAEAMVAEGRHAAPLILFLFCTGARVGEALALEWRDVDLQHARCTLRETKNGLDRIVDLPPRMVATMANLPHRLGRVFRRWAGKNYRTTTKPGKPQYGNQMRKAWDGALSRGKVNRKVTPHHARHSWATWHYAVHRDLLKLKADGCWASVSQVERYAKLAPAGMAPAVQKFWGFTGAQLVQAPIGPLSEAAKTG